MRVRVCVCVCLCPFAQLPMAIGMQYVRTAKASELCECVYTKQTPMK